MADPSKPKSGGGCLGILVFLVLLIASLGLGAALFFIAQPQDLSDIGGNGPAVAATPTRDMKTVLQSAIDRGYAVTLTETEINQWLGRTLQAKQGGALGSQISLERVWVRLETGRAEVIMERKFMGHSFTVSMFLRIEQLQGLKGVETQVHLDGGPYHESLPKPPQGGRFGKLVVPQGFLLLIRPAYEKLPALFQEEIHLGFEQMSRMKIEKNRLVLDPRDPSAGSMGLPQTF